MAGLTLKDRLVKRIKQIPERIFGLTDDVRGIVLHDVSKFRDAATVDNPTGLRGLVKLYLDFGTKLICRAGSPVRFPMEGIQASMRYIHQPGESSTQRRLLPHKAW